MAEEDYITFKHCKIDAKHNLIKDSYIGILTDVSELDNPKLISDEKRLNDILISSIAERKPRYFEDDNSWMLEKNINDPFINKNYTVDFIKQDILVVRGAVIEKVTFTAEEGGQYLITFGKDPIKDYEYYAVVVQPPQIVGKLKGFVCANEKPKIENYQRVFIS